MRWIHGVIIACVSAAGCPEAGGESPSGTEQTQTPDQLSLTCADGAVMTEGDYRAENNTWGKGSVTGWSQCVGIGKGPNNSVSARFTWNWPESGGNVKAYPELIFGFKPSTSSTTLSLPKVVSLLQELSVRYDLTSTHSGTGNTAFDLWLTDTTRPASFTSPPITHEIMVWLESYGSMAPGGTYRERTSIENDAYDVYVGENFGSGWRYIAFRMVDNRRGNDTLDFMPLLEYARLSNLITGAEYLSSIEFGNEVVSGIGDTKINEYAVTVR